MRSKFYNTCYVALSALLLLSSSKTKAQNAAVKVDWNKVVTESKTTPTLQVVYNPYVRSNSPIYKGTFDALKNLGASYVRYVPWFPYPHAAVAELKEPTKTETFWDFTYADPTMEDIMKAQEGRSVVINFSTIPVWMFKTEKPVVVDPNNPDALVWDYNQGKELRDPSFKEVAAYFGRLISWYTKGGFTDELGKYHKSGHYYKIPYWEVLNEPDLEHKMSPEYYTKIYDAIVAEMHKVSPDTKFVGISVAHETDPNWFEHFLNPKNHKPGIPLDAISYHFYGHPVVDSVSVYKYSFFEQANGFLDRVRYIENIRKRLSPHTITTINEIGNIIAGHDYQKPISPAYWNLSGAMYAYIYVELAKLGIEVAGESQLVGYPTQFPDVSMMDWTNGKPNSRYWVLKLLKDNFGPGDKLVSTSVNTPGVAAQGFATTKGKKLFLINKTDGNVQLDLPQGANNASVNYVDISTGDNPVASTQLSGSKITLTPFEVAVVNMK